MDRLDAIRLFVRVVEKGSFSAAAREAGIGQSAASKQIAALEARLGAQLLQRTSRSLAVTELGQSVYDAALRLVEDFSALDSLVGQGQSNPSGLVRVAVAPVFGRLYIVPRLPEFFGLFPNISVEMSASDRHVDLIEDGFDLAIRHGDLSDSSMTVRKLATSPFLTVATPTYFERHGTPTTPGDLTGHACITFASQQSIRPWRFAGGAVHRPDGPFRTSDAEQGRAALLAHLGIAHMPAWIVAPELASGALHLALRDYEMETTTINAVYPSRRHLPTKVRLLLDFLARTLALDLNLPC
ncbi:LysR family transcriptional regulator [Acidisoma cellulosilytica]|uniref:LysR family transcriptional regulator n=1 Tax=Acidisoma cellulosilyticum TaxID=2802395 RepID=A0A963Z091_9PROT|nr:LysR family transcriptional regulator [Acidisoma cellulosilyticum]MCB8879627.1 LysR family transcriptional regulator [Acidisoma cellulosilyticum]